MSFYLSTSSTADLRAELLEEREIEYIPFTFTIEGQEYPDDLGHTIKPHKFYEMIEAGAQPTTSQINVQEYLNKFRPIAAKGMDIVHIEISSAVSGAFQSLMIAKKELEEEFPKNNFYFIDSLSGSSGLGMLVIMAADLRDEGKSAKEVNDFIENKKIKIEHWVFATNLDHFRRGGRISAIPAKIGSLLKICPIITMDNGGKLDTLENVRGKKRGLKFLADKVIERAKNNEAYDGRIYISHSNFQEEAEIVKENLEKDFHSLKEEIQIFNIGAVVGSHTGNGTLAVFFEGEKGREV